MVKPGEHDEQDENEIVSFYQDLRSGINEGIRNGKDSLLLCFQKYSPFKNLFEGITNLQSKIYSVYNDHSSWEQF